MIRELLKEQTFAAHQKTEGIVIRKVKEIESENDYIELLRCFYSFFNSVEQKMLQFVTEEVLYDIATRRNSSYILADIEELGGTIENLPEAIVPEMNNTLDALSAMYVLEGSIMGGPYIVKMLEKRGMDRAFSFFQGYGENSGRMFGIFAEVLNNYGKDSSQHERAIEVANETFKNFGDVFQVMTTA